MRALRSRLIVVAALTAGVAMLGWLWPQAARLPRIFDSFPAMVPATALTVLVLCAALWTRQPRRRAFAAAAVALCSLVMLATDVGGSLTDPGGADRYADRVSTGTAVALGLIAVSMLAQRRAVIGAATVSTALLLGFWCVLGFALDAPALFDFPLLSGMSLPTAICLMALSLARMLDLRDQSWIGLLVAPGPAARSARRGLLVAAGAPLCLALALNAMIGAGVLATSLGMALLTGIITGVAGLTVLALSRERVLAEGLQQTENDWLRTIFDTTGVAAIVFDETGQPVLSNRLADELTQQAGGPEHWLRSTQFFVPGTLEPLSGPRHPSALLAAGNTEGRLYVGWIDPERGQRDLGLHVHHVGTSARGRITILTVVDETESWTARDHITRIERLEAVGLMAGSASHEFGNIFGALQLTADVGLMQPDGPMRAQFDAVSEACRRGAAMTRRLLELSREGVATSEPLDLLTLLPETETMLNAALAGEIALVIRLPDAPVTVVANRSDLVAVLLNLVRNARDAIRETPGADRTIWLDVAVDDKTVSLTLRDRGAGMSAETLARATMPFFTSRRGGTGLGLSMADSFARRSGGKLTLTSALGQGTSVRIDLPLAGAEPALAADTQAAPQPPDLSHMRILVVEDDVQFRTALSSALMTLGPAITRETSAEAALDRLEGGARFDLLLTDIRLPGEMTGLDLVRHAVDIAPDMAILLMTGYHDRSSRWSEESGHMVLRKPMSLQMLANAIRIVRPDSGSRARADYLATGSTPPETDPEALAPRKETPAPSGSPET